MRTLSRRKLLLWTGALAGGSAAIAGGVLALRPPDGIFGKMIRRLLPGVTLDEAGLELFEAEMSGQLAASQPADMKLRAALIVSDLIGYGNLVKFPPVGTRVADVERAALTFFLQFSDFFPRDETPGARVTYYGISDLACPNPFVEFD